MIVDDSFSCPGCRLISGSANYVSDDQIPIPDGFVNTRHGRQPFAGPICQTIGVRSFGEMEYDIQAILIMLPGYFSLKIEYTWERKEGFVQLGHS